MTGESILIVDDNPQNLKLARIILEQAGYDVATASAAEEALSVLDIVRPRLILMDLQLPQMDGLELTRRLKSDPRYRNIVIIALTAYAMKGDEQKVFAAGCDGYLAKPIDVDCLTSAVAGHLSGAAATAPTNSPTD